MKAQVVAPAVKANFPAEFPGLRFTRTRRNPRGMFIAWTTVATRADAERLAACVQLDGPVVSHYRWQGRAERAEEFRLCFKCLLAQLPALEKQVLATHPYDTPEWLVVRADRRSGQDSSPGGRRREDTPASDQKVFHVPSRRRSATAR